MASRSRKPVNGNPQNAGQAPESETLAGMNVELRLADDMTIHINIGNCQDQGARPYQEDSFGYSNIVDSDVVTQRGLIAVLADGMGGLSNGKAVSDYVVKASIARFDQINIARPIRPQLEEILRSVNQDVCRDYSRDGVSTAGSTAVLAYIYRSRLYWAVVGDSRLYCLRGGNLLQMNEDQDFRNHLYRQYLEGDGTLEAIEQERQKDSLVSFIGREGLNKIDSSVRGYPILPGDSFILCSDGIYNAISEETLKHLVMSYDAQTASERIVQAVLQARLPGQDNLTVMVIKCSKGNAP